MRIREIRVEGFGGLRERTISLEGQASILYGANEAGKSTLLQLIRSVLFGFAPRGQGTDRFEPEGGGPHGGALVLELEDGERVRVSRRSGDGAKGRGRSPSAGLVTVTRSDGSSGGEELLRELMPGISGEQFRNLFAFTLTELQELRTLTSEELGGFLHSAGLGVRASAVMEAEKRLAQELDARFRPRGRSQGIGRLLAESEALDSAWRRSLAEAGRYNALEEESAAVTARIGEAEACLAELRLKHSFLLTAQGLREHWARYVRVTGERSELPDRTGYPEQGLQRQESLLQELEQTASRLVRLRSRQEELERTVQDYTEEDAVWIGRQEELQVLAEAYRLYKAGFSQEQELLQELTGQEQELQRRLAEAGLPAGSWRQICSMPALSLGSRDEAQRLREQWEDLSRRRSRLQAQQENGSRALLEAREAAAERKSQLDQAVKRMRAHYPAHAGELASSLPPLIRELRKELALSSDAVRELKHARERELEHQLSMEQLRAQSEGAVKPEERGNSGASAFVVVLALVLGLGAGAALFFSLRAAWLPAGVCVVLSAVSGLLLVRRLGVRKERNGSRSGGGRSSRSRMSMSGYAEAEAEDHALSPIALRRHELEQAEAEQRGRVEAKLRQLGLHLESAAASEGFIRALAPGSQWDESLPDQLEQWLDDLLEQLRLQAQLEEKWSEAAQVVVRQNQQLQQLAEQEKLLDKEEALILAAWQEWLSQWKVNSGRLSPGLASEFLHRLEQIGLLGEAMAAINSRLARLHEERLSYEAQASALLGEAASSEDRILLALQSAKRKVEEGSRRFTRKLEAEQELERLLLELRAEAETGSRCSQRLEVLWDQANAANEEEFRRFGAEHEARARLEEERKSLVEILSVGAGAQAGQLEQLDQVLREHSPAELESELAVAEAALAEQTGLLDQWKEEKGRLAAEYAKLLDGSSHGELREKQEELLARIGSEAADWAVYAMAAGLLQKAKSAYEKERQPEVLRQASEHFARLTGGRYSRIVAPLGEERLYALRPDGQALESSRLSRGTAEQLYLCLRFALAREFAKRTALPLVMDDVFVNFDGERLELAARELSELSGQHQLLLFTCHRHVLEAVQAAVPGIQTITLS